jgi:hypothetical protein
MPADVLGNGGIPGARVAIKELADFVPSQTARGGEGVFVDGFRTGGRLE